MKYVFSQKELNMRQRRRLEYMKDYECSIEYTTGKGNFVTDALTQKYTGF